jgi:hypothetical protein
MHLGLLMLRLRDLAEGLQVDVAMLLREPVVDGAANVSCAYTISAISFAALRRTYLMA